MPARSTKSAEGFQTKTAHTDLLTPRVNFSPLCLRAKVLQLYLWFSCSLLSWQIPYF